MTMAVAGVIPANPATVSPTSTMKASAMPGATSGRET